jgi:hypothetical protein
MRPEPLPSRELFQFRNRLAGFRAVSMQG